MSRPDPQCFSASYSNPGCQSNDLKARIQSLEAELAQKDTAPRFTGNGSGFDFAAELKGCELHAAMLEVMNHQNLEWTEEYAKLEIKVESLEASLKEATEIAFKNAALVDELRHERNALQRISAEKSHKVAALTEVLKQAQETIIEGYQPCSEMSCEQPCCVIHREISKALGE